MGLKRDQMSSLFIPTMQHYLIISAMTIHFWESTIWPIIRPRQILSVYSFNISKTLILKIMLQLLNKLKCQYVSTGNANSVLHYYFTFAIILLGSLFQIFYITPRQTVSITVYCVYKYIHDFTIIMLHYEITRQFCSGDRMPNCYKWVFQRSKIS